ncbi:MAG: hypothetical protein OHK93_004570 [Ramalina farinacea]|uniref:Uncharacterized protein n=1 Tax=Ramalina farinacea TaxID=258253 RepID=A0AA43QV02_9LECA|nr:hypothetical protein [Ramalina farinacea]
MPFQLGQRGEGPASDAVRFQQQGQVDWTRLSADSVNASIQILSRISAAGIDPFTIVMGQAIGGSLLWRDEGRKRFDEALQSCRGLASYRNVLWFGFGVKHVAHVLTATDQGAVCAGLCSCVAECYTTAYAAGIMMEMTKISNPPAEFTPSLLQWRNLVHSCAGLVSSSTFALCAEQFMRFSGDLRVASRHSQCDHNYPGRGISHKTQIAEALLGLAKLSRGVLFQMTIVGGADAGFLAALADWLLGLDVEVRGGKEQETLFRNCTLDKQPQLIIMYDDNAQPNGLQCVGKTYRLPDASGILTSEDGALQWTLLGGRVPWESALDWTFGGYFRKLLGMKQACGAAIGSAARIYQALSDGDESFGDAKEDWRFQCRTYFSDSHGLALVHFITQRFPELGNLHETMGLNARASTVQKAWMVFESSMTSISTGCGCQRCSGELARGQGPHGHFCLVFLVYTILHLSRALSGIVTQLRPTRVGLEILYDQVLYDGLNHPVVAGEHLMQKAAPNNATVTSQQRLSRAQLIFGGDRGHGQTYLVKSDSTWTSAMAINGLCYCYDILLRPSFSSAQAARICVVNGRIEHNGRAYDHLSDGGQNTPPSSGLFPGGAPGFSRYLLERLADSNGSRLEVLVSERFDGLAFEYAVCKDSNTLMTFGPAKVVDSMSHNEGLVSCARKGHCTESPQVPDLLKAIALCSQEKKTFCRLKHGQEEFVLVLGDIVSKLMAIDASWTPIVQRDECLACCVRSGVRRGNKSITIIMGGGGARDAALA